MCNFVSSHNCKLCHIIIPEKEFVNLENICAKARIYTNNVITRWIITRDYILFSLILFQYLLSL